MARRSGGSHKCVEEKRRMLPIYQHYTLSPGRTKSHHPEAKCIHCLKEFVCGSKQRLIRHLRKCNSITNPEQIIAETLNTLARNSATGQLNHSILEASNLLPSQISHIHHSATQQLVGHYHSSPQQHQPNNNHSSATSSSGSTTITTANNNIISSNSSLNNGSNGNNIDGNLNHDTSGSNLTSNDSIILTNSVDGQTIATAYNSIIPVKKTRRGRKPANQGSSGPGIHVTTGLDGKTQFTPISQLPPGIISSSPQLLTTVHNSIARGVSAYPTIHHATGSNVSASVAPNASPVVHTGASFNSGHQIHLAPFKLNTEPIDKAYLKLVLTRNLPLSLCDTKEFQNWVKTFANDYKPPISINLIAHNLKQEAQSARQRVSNIVVKAPKKTVNLELQCWSDHLRGHIWYVIIAVIDTRRFLISVKDVLSQSVGSTNQQLDNNGSLISYEYTNDGHILPTDHRVLIDFIDDCIKRVGSDRVNSLMFTTKMMNQHSVATRAHQALNSNHPSIVTYFCWWNFTNLLCSDIVAGDESFQELIRNSNTLINFVNKRSQLYLKLERFNPFAGALGSLNHTKDYIRWYAHLVCYLLRFIKNNNEAIQKALEIYCSHVETTRLLPSSDNNNNSSSSLRDQNATNVQQSNSDDSNLQCTQQQPKHNPLLNERAQIAELRSIILSSDYWTKLDLALVYLKPFRDIVALISNPMTTSDSEISDTNLKTTPVISTTHHSHLSLSDYMNWFLTYGKSLFDSLRQSPDRCKFKLVSQYIRRFNSSMTDFRLLFAAYLLNPKYRCAYVTQKAKDLAIEEILNIASEFMPEESDGHTIFDQWKLYLVREEPYDMVFEESRSTALDWWMSLPCAESIRRVALRILRLKAFSSPKPDSIFSQLYLYEDETKTRLNKSAFEDLAMLRYFYDHEDRVTLFSNPSTAHSANGNIIHMSPLDRSEVGHAHNDLMNDTINSSKYLPSGGLGSASTPDTPNGHFGPEALNTSDGGELRIFTDAVESYMTSSRIEQQLESEFRHFSLDNLPAFQEFASYIDFNQQGIEIAEEPIEKKRRKWTAQEILSRCQPSSNRSNGASSNNTANNKSNEK